MSTVPERRLRIVSPVELAQTLLERKTHSCDAWQVSGHEDFLFVDITEEVLTRRDPDRDIPVFAFYKWNEKESVWRMLGSRLLFGFNQETAEHFISEVLDGIHDLGYRIGSRRFELKLVKDHSCEHCSLA